MKMTDTAENIRRIAMSLGVSRANKIVKIHRVYAGRHQRASGAWSWYATDADGNEIVGSPDSAREIIWADRLGMVVAVEGPYMSSSREICVQPPLPCPSCKRR